MFLRQKNDNMSDEYFTKEFEGGFL